jgi:hypothetical protein
MNRATYTGPVMSRHESAMIVHQLHTGTPSESYTGPLFPLKGKRALVMVKDGKLTAQFNDFNTGYAFGWHEFPVADFQVDE